MKNNLRFTLKDAQFYAFSLLKKISPTPIKEANLLLSLILPKNPLYYPPEYQLSASQTKKFLNFTNRRANSEPIAYLQGSISFYRQKIYVNKYTLIPRPETEELVEIVIKYINSLKINNYLPLEARRVKWGKLKITDIGTGSGAIAIALTKSHPSLKITATDVSSKALAIAKKNIFYHQLQHRISLKKTNLLQNFPLNSLNIIIANLPYIPHNILPTLDSTISFEPKIALNGGKDGLKYIKTILLQSKNILRPQGQIFLEIWHTHRRPLTEFVKNHLPNYSIKIIKDINGLDRFAFFQKD